MSGAARRMTRATLAPMTGKIEAYDHLPETARAIREQVFIRERDWRPEFDEWDAVAVHLLAFDGNRTRGDMPILCGSRPFRSSREGT